VSGFNLVKTFCATKFRDREELGDRITKWIRKLPRNVRIVDKAVLQSSDTEFHCLTIVLFCYVD
jgi:hypothetical protein